MIYVDDADFLTENQAEKEEMNKIVAENLMKENLKVNESKTEHTIINRSTRDDEKWRMKKKLGSLLGDSEDMVARKQLTTAAMTGMEKIWLRKGKIGIDKRLKLYNALVKPILTIQAHGASRRTKRNPQMHFTDNSYEKYGEISG